MIYKIAYFTLMTIGSLWLIWELIPDSTKKWWNYIRMTGQDRRSGKPRKYIFSFRDGIGQNKG